MVEHKDVVFAIMGTSATLAGAVLVVLGILMAPDPTTRGPLHRRQIMYAASIFLYNMITVGLATIWLLLPPAPQDVSFPNVNWWFVLIVSYFLATVFLDGLLVVVVVRLSIRGHRRK